MVNLWVAWKEVLASGWRVTHSWLYACNIWSGQDIHMYPETYIKQCSQLCIKQSKHYALNSVRREIITLVGHKRKVQGQATANDAHAIGSY